MEKELQEATLQRVDGSGEPILIPEEALYHYKGLVGQIEVALPQQYSRVLLFSSSLEQEGTTEVIVGLGMVLAAGMGRMTAIIDCNPSHPELAKRFGTGPIGLNEFIKEMVPLEQALSNTMVPNLHIMPLGEKFTTLAAFGEERLRSGIKKLREKFEYVLIDSAPIGLNPDMTVMCDKVDAVILVVRHGKTRREVVKRTKDIIERAGGRVLGAVLNRRKFPIPEFLYRRL